MSVNEATWTNGKQRVTGRWVYIWSRDVFLICLDGVDEITGRPRKFETHNDSPEWGKWKLAEETAKVKQWNPTTFF